MADSLLPTFHRHVNSILLDPKNHDLLTLVKALRNGLVYGTKVRLPHALVMVFLFRTGTLSSKLRAIYSATRLHALNLASFAFTYKLLTISARRIYASPRTSNSSRRLMNRLPPSSLLAGITAGYLVFGRQTAASKSVNQQIVIYVFARVVLALASLAFLPTSASPSQAGYGPKSRPPPLRSPIDAVLRSVAGMRDPEARESFKASVRRGAWPVFAAGSWGLVMWLFEEWPDLLQPSLRGSMRYLYEEAERWDGVRNFVWHNR
ncbi:MAG: hypothetical protein M1828_001528 [Chrysothrix sp. TS-e1954]|nr:MAG: hypothetical protein M1828_001528 [Chrysothrix sp. TS-e1954]